jgi:uncharacterized protein
VDRVFLDANVLYSAAFKAGSKLLELWHLSETELLTSALAAEEARRNLAMERPGQIKALEVLLAALAVVPDPPVDFTLPSDIKLAEKDQPILAAAMLADASHLLTGDKTHFGRYFGRRVAGLLILRPADYLERTTS